MVGFRLENSVCLLAKMWLVRCLSILCWVDKAAFSRWGSVLFSSTVDGDTRDFQFLWLRLLSAQNIKASPF